MWKILKIIICLVICLGILVPAQGESGFEPRDTKAYESVENVYKMDFSVSDLKEYTSKDEWAISSASSAVIENGKLTCKSGRSFSIRPGFTIGDDYGLEPGYFTFDLVMTGGQISIGTRLFSNVTIKGTQGLWFTLTKDNLVVEDPSTKLKETINHGMDLSTEQNVRVLDNLDTIEFRINDTVICSVTIENEKLMLFDANGNELAAMKNETVPHAGYLRMDVDKLQGSLDNVEYANRQITQKYVERHGRDIDYSTWFAVDDLGRKTPDNEEAGNRKNEKYVGLFYFINHVHSSGGEIRDHTKIYLEQGLDALKAFLPNSPGGHWAEPYFGYYLSTDEWIYRKHAAMFQAAGIDFIFLDMSNAQTFPESVKVLFDTWLDIRRKGGQTPQIVPMCGDMPATLVIDMYTIKDTIFSIPEYEELLFKWDGKPLILGNNDNPEGDLWTVSGTTPQTREQFYEVINSNSKIKQFYESGEFAEWLSKFTIRKCWAWQASRYEEDKSFAGYWDWLDWHPQAPGRNFDGVIEQISVTMGTHAHTSTGRSYVGEKDYGNGLQDFDFSLETSKYGLCFEQQFKHALKENPKVIMITGWNEWYAGVQKTQNKQQTTGHTLTPGYYLVDQFNPEFSRDGEPMKLRTGVGFGDNYYYQMVNYIRQFKGMDKTPVAFGQKTIDISKGISEWADVGPEFRDHLNDTTFRRHLSWGGVYTYINNTGRNDLDYAKVSQDADNLYFLIATAHDLVTVDEDNWMNLFINTDINHETGWEGYDFVLNRSRDGKTVSVEKFVDNDWDFEKVGDAEYFMGDNFIAIKVSKSILGITEELASFDFKWADNSTKTGDVMQFMDMGDAAPDSRFAFRYLGTAPATKKSSPNFFANIFNPANWTAVHLVVFSVIAAAIIIVVAVILAKPKKK